MSEKKTYNVDAPFDGMRLDKVLWEVLPETGLRFRRRLCDQGSVSINGRHRKPGYKVKVGEEIVISLRSNEMTHDDLGLVLVKKTGIFAAISKPGRVHSATIDGKDTPSVEGSLNVLFPDFSPILLNRLDYLTSGLVMVALEEKGRNAYLKKEAAGEIKKFYLARVQGRMDGMVTIRNMLDTDDRKKTRVLSEDNSDDRRWTEVDVVSHDNKAETTLVRCLISKGARHQIRAHLASIGHPILGDPLYGDGKSDKVLQLHHQRIEFPGFSAEIKPPF